MLADGDVVGAAGDAPGGAEVPLAPVPSEPAFPLPAELALVDFEPLLPACWSKSPVLCWATGSGGDVSEVPGAFAWPPFAAVVADDGVAPVAVPVWPVDAG